MPSVPVSLPVSVSVSVSYSPITGAHAFLISVCLKTTEIFNGMFAEF